MESSCNPLGFSGGVSFSEHVTPIHPVHSQERVLTLADLLTQRYNDVPKVIVLIYSKQFWLGCKILVRFMQLLWWTPNLSRLTCPPNLFRYVLCTQRGQEVNKPVHPSQTGVLSPKWFHHLLTLKLHQTRLSFFLLSIKKDILKNVSNQTVAGSYQLTWGGESANVILKLLLLFQLLCTILQ